MNAVDGSISGMRISRTTWLSLAVAAAILIPFAIFGERVDAAFSRWVSQAAAHPLRSAFVLVGLLVVDIVAPVPSSLVSTACGAILGFWGGLLASFAGMTISSVAGYGLGRWASGWTLRWVGKREAEALRQFESRYGIGFLVALRPVPVLAEASTVFAGLSRLPFPRALVALSLGNLGVSAVYAAVGAWGGDRDAFLAAFGAAILLTGLAMLWQKRRVAPGPRP